MSRLYQGVERSGAAGCLFALGALLFACQADDTTAPWVERRGFIEARSVETADAGDRNNEMVSDGGLEGGTATTSETDSPRAPRPLRATRVLLENDLQIPLYLTRDCRGPTWFEFDAPGDDLPDMVCVCDPEDNSPRCPSGPAAQPTCEASWDVLMPGASATASVEPASLTWRRDAECYVREGLEEEAPFELRVAMSTTMGVASGRLYIAKSLPYGIQDASFLASEATVLRD
ncbi:MAG: hypothetical protein OXU20_02845 [Myxococcales bacterium]|nr:hypothetical protein [Myxococcales bacterium]MDD9965153.1 hypothetical protein [Myxococcales bacterium]